MFLDILTEMINFFRPFQNHLGLLPKKKQVGY